MLCQSHIRQLLAFSLGCLLTFFTNPAVSADRKAIKAEQSRLLRDLLDQLFELEHQIGKSNKETDLTPEFTVVKKAYEKIAQTLEPGTRLHLDKTLSKLKSKHSSPQELEQTFYQLKQETIAAFKIDTAPPLSPNFELASAQYMEYCSSCHGNTGNGDGVLSKRLPKKPEDFTSLQFSQKNSPLRTLNKLLVGSKQTGMPIFEHQLSNQDLWSISFYVQTLAYVPNNDSLNFESTLIKRGLNYSLLARLNDDELLIWLSKNLNELNTTSKDAQKNIIASIRHHYSFSKNVPRR